MIKTTGKEYFYMVSGLMVPKYMVNDTLHEDIEYFVDWVSKRANHLEYSVRKRMDTFITQMETLYEMLCKIYAHWLEKEASMILRLTDINDNELCEKLVVPFVANLHTLAVDIQMAQNRGFENSYRQRNEIERCKSVVSSMKIIATLIKSADFENAFDTAISINDLQESEYAVPFMSSIALKNETKTLNLANEIINLYTKKIDEIIDIATKTVAMKKILIVDDLPEMLTALSFMLKEHYQVYAFTNGEETLNFIDKKQQPDAFILDIEMPDMDGFALAKKIRERAQYSKTPILFLTGNSSRETIMKSVMYGAKAFIIKPANKDIIISKLSSCLDL